MKVKKPGCVRETAGKDLRNMSDGKQIPLSRMESGQSGKVIDIQGGHGVIRRLDALGIRSGRSITKISSMFMRGPVTLQIGNSHIAIGFGMAKRILIELDHEK